MRRGRGFGFVSFGGADVLVFHSTRSLSLATRGNQVEDSGRGRPGDGLGGAHSIAGDDGSLVILSCMRPRWPRREQQFKSARRGESRAGTRLVASATAPCSPRPLPPLQSVPVIRTSLAAGSPTLVSTAAAAHIPLRPHHHGPDHQHAPSPGHRPSTPKRRRRMPPASRGRATAALITCRCLQYAAARRLVCALYAR